MYCPRNIRNVRNVRNVVAALIGLAGFGKRRKTSVSGVFNSDNFALPQALLPPYRNHD